MLLAKVVGASYLLFGLFGLLVVSVPDHRQRMSLAPGGSRSLGMARLAHAYIVLLSLITCGLAVWAMPALAVNLAWLVLALVLLGKSITLVSGETVTCRRCLVLGVSIIMASTLAIVLGMPLQGGG